MKPPLEEIEKMLSEITYWPVMQVGAGCKQIDCYEIISDLVDEVKILANAYATFETQYFDKKIQCDYLKEETKRLREALEFYGKEKHIMSPEYSPGSSSDYSYFIVGCDDCGVRHIEDGNLAHKALKGK